MGGAAASCPSRIADELYRRAGEAPPRERIQRRAPASIWPEAAPVAGESQDLPAFRPTLAGCCFFGPPGALLCQMSEDLCTSFFFPKSNRRFCFALLAELTGQASWHPMGTSLPKPSFPSPVVDQGDNPRFQPGEHVSAPLMRT